MCVSSSSCGHTGERTFRCRDRRPRALGNYFICETHITGKRSSKQCSRRNVNLESINNPNMHVYIFIYISIYICTYIHVYMYIYIDVYYDKIFKRVIWEIIVVIIIINSSAAGQLGVILACMLCFSLFEHLYDLDDRNIFTKHFFLCSPWYSDEQTPSIIALSLGIHSEMYQ